MPIETDIRFFALITSDGTAYEPIAAGGGADLIFPIDSLQLGREMGQILASDAQVLMKRISTTSVLLEADPSATLAFVFQLPERSTALASAAGRHRARAGAMTTTAGTVCRPRARPPSGRAEACEQRALRRGARAAFSGIGACLDRGRRRVCACSTASPPR